MASSSESYPLATTDGAITIYMLQGLPGVGPALPNRLLLHFGTVEHVITADEITLMHVPGLGRKKVRRIREVVS